MKLRDIPAPSVEGVYGPECLLNSQTGEGCLRDDAGQLVGSMPSAPITNAFLVWVGMPVLVVSQGVAQADSERVADRLRERFDAPDLPVIFDRGRRTHGAGHIVHSEAQAAATEELARAEGYALVQLAWEEDEVTVQMGRDVFSFDVRFVETGPGDFRPQLTLVNGGG
jgi:hypothetical protein